MGADFSLDTVGVDGSFDAVMIGGSFDTVCVEYTGFELDFCLAFALIPCNLHEKISSKQNRNRPCDKQF